MKELTPRHVRALLAKIAKLEDVNAKLRATRSKNVNGGTKEVDRGAWCTPRKWTDRIGAWDLDPFSNLRSHVQADAFCALERGDTGIADRAVPGSYTIAGVGTFVATANTRPFIQPPYELVLEAIAHYGHTRFCALLRFDTSTEWYRRLYRLTELVCVANSRISFEPPPGIKKSSNPYPHAFFYARAEDATPEVLRTCTAWRTR